jgi:hypothetical protein
MACILCKNVIFFTMGFGGGGGGRIKQEANEHKCARNLSYTHMIELSFWANYKKDKSFPLIWLNNTLLIKVI